MPQTRRWHPGQESDELIFAVCDRFLRQLGDQYDACETPKRGRKGAPPR